MKNKTILIIAISGVVAALVVVVFVIVLGKKSTPQPVLSTPTPTTGTGTVSNGAAPDLAVVGSGVVTVLTPKTDSTQPYATTAPRVEPPAKSSGSGVALQPATNTTSTTTTQTTQQAAGSNDISYNYNQSDDSFLSSYYPDANQVISGDEGPAGNVGQDPANQILYTTAPVAATTPALTAPTNFDMSSITTSTNNTTSSIQNYLSTLASTTSGFDIINNTNLVTDPLQNLDSKAAAQDGIEATAVLQALQALTVPSSLADLQASYVAAYEQYITYTNQLQALLNSGGTSAIASAEGTLQTATSNIATVLETASTNYQNAVAFYTTQSQ